jgi:hypothetical protein
VKYKIKKEPVNMKGLEGNITHKIPVYSDDENKLGKFMIALKKRRDIS